MFNARGLKRRSRKDYSKHKELSRALVHERITHYNAFYQFAVGRVFIKNHKSRWGSCSKLGNLNFNYKLVHLPPQLADYIIVHELCHLAHFNHSTKFWALVARTTPNHLQLRHQLRALERTRGNGVV